MADLRDELIRRRRGEDSCITIERHRERHCNIEGRNLERDFESLALARDAPVTFAMQPPSSPAGSRGVWHLHHISGWWSGHKFQPHLPEKYDGMINPTKFLQIYSTSILAVGGDETVVTNYFPVALNRTALSWLMNLSEGTLTSWQELCHQFIANFKSAYTWSGN
jgi:hypothetical protein